MRQIYLDYNATTPISPLVQEAMLPFLAEHYGNPSSDHAFGRACAEAIADARFQVASLLGVSVDEIVFTSGGTESNNLALKGIMMRAAPNDGGHFIISSLEHPAIVEPANFLERLGYDLTVVGANAHGVVDPEEVKDAIRTDTVLVSIMYANNEIGTVQPIREISRICQERDVLCHTDAAQAIGKLPVMIKELGVDLLTIAGHKMYAPKGVGALYIKRGTMIDPVQHGAGHERGLRAGTENVPYIVALGKAAVLASKGLEEHQQQMLRLRDRLLEQLRDVIGDRLTVNGEQSPRLPNTLSVNFPDVSGGELLARIPEVCASTGAACHSGSIAISPTLAAIGMSSEEAIGTVRLSVGWYTSEEEIDRAASLLLGAWEALQR